MEIRRAELKDMPRITDLLNQVLTVHHNGRPDLFKAGCRKYTDAELTRLIADNSKPIFVADVDGIVQGYAFCVLIRHTDDNILTDIKTLYIDDLCVDEAARGKHIGTALYDYVLDYAKGIGCYNVTLNVWYCNKKAMAFYESRGLAPQKIGMEKIL